MPIMPPDKGITARRKTHQLRPQPQDVDRMTDEELQLRTGDLHLLPQQPPSRRDEPSHVSS